MDTRRVKIARCVHCNGFTLASTLPEGDTNKNHVEDFRLAAVGGDRIAYVPASEMHSGSIKMCTCRRGGGSQLDLIDATGKTL